MVDAPVVHIGENSPEEVALKLLDKIASVERVTFYHGDTPGEQVATREWLLNTYVQCLRATKLGVAPKQGEPDPSSWLKRG